MSNNVKVVIVKWKRYQSYDKASSDQSKGIYIHDWQQKPPYYVGKLDKATFRKRYNTAYSHWIDGCLEHGARLFIGAINQKDTIDSEIIENVERIITLHLRPVKNVILKTPYLKFKLLHEGQVPEYLQ